MKDPPGPKEFATTHWSLVGAANLHGVSQTRAREALEQLAGPTGIPSTPSCVAGHSAVDAQDLT